MVSGGSGNDTFRLGRGDDVFTDFLRGEDLLEGESFAFFDSNSDGVLDNADDRVTVLDTENQMILDVAADSTTTLLAVSELVTEDFTVVA